VLEQIPWVSLARLASTYLRETSVATAPEGGERRDVATDTLATAAALTMPVPATTRSGRAASSLLVLGRQHSSSLRPSRRARRLRLVAKAIARS
jgi:hypothetical protein